MEEQLSLLIQLQEVDAKIRIQSEQKKKLPKSLQRWSGGALLRTMISLW